MRQSVLSNMEKLKDACESSYSLKEVLDKMGLRAAGGNYKQLKMWAERHGIPLPEQNEEHFRRKTESAHKQNRFSDDLVFCENSKCTNRSSIKKRLRNMGWEWVCSTPGCNVSEEWLGLSITLQLDHINGVWNDNRLENLRLLCPNCHSQTETFAGRSSIK